MPGIVAVADVSDASIDGTPEGVEAAGEEEKEEEFTDENWTIKRLVRVLVIRFESHGPRLLFSFWLCLQVTSRPGL